MTEAPRTGDSSGPAGAGGAPAAAPRAIRGRDAWWFAALLVLALGLRVAALVDHEARHPHADAPVIDEASYDRWAREIAAGDWIGDEVFFQEPLYPYALGAVYAVTGGDRTAARGAQVALGVLTVALVFLLARRAFGARAGWIAGALVAAHPVAVALPCWLLKPNLALPVFAGLAVMLTAADDGRARRWVAVGALAGLGALLRGNLLVMLPFLALWPLWRDRGRAGFARVGGFALGVALVLAPVAVRNQAVGGVFALTTSGAGTNLFGGNTLENPYGVATEFPWVRGVPDHEATDWRVEAERRSGRELDAGETSRFWTRELFASMRAQPAAHARVLWNKFRLTLGAYEVADNRFLPWEARFVRVLRAPLPGWGVTGALGVAGMLVWVVSRRRADAATRAAGDRLAVLFVLYLGTIVLTVTSMRARLPLLVAVAPFAGWYAARVVDAARSGGSRAARLGGLLAAGSVAAVLVHAPVFDAGQRARDLAERDHNLAVELLATGEVTEAAALAATLRADFPNSARLVVLDAAARAEMVFAELERGAPRTAGHQEALRACLRDLRAVFDDADVAPRERARAAGVAARIQEGLGQTARAERQLRRAREFAPADADLLATHARLLTLRLAAEAPGADDAADLRAAVDAVLADLARYGDPQGVAADLNAARR